MKKIVTTFMYPPIPLRQFDWLAMFECDDGDSPRKGYGATEEEAVADLLNNHDQPGVDIDTSIPELARDKRVLEIHQTDDSLRLVIEIDDDELTEQEYQPMDDNFFRKLTDDETKQFRQWARDNFKPGDPISPVWHPVVREECKEIEAGR